MKLEFTVLVHFLNPRKTVLHFTFSVKFGEISLKYNLNFTEKPLFKILISFLTNHHSKVGNISPFCRTTDI